jgi:hypothetical protein
VTFDTLAAVKKLEGSGMPEQQAEAVVEVIRDTRSTDLSELATKADLTTLRADIAMVRADLRSEISTLRSDTAKWIIGAVLVNALTVIGGMVGLAALLGRIPKVP